MNNFREKLEKEKLRILRSQPREKLSKNDLRIISLFSIASLIACAVIYSLAR